MDETHSLDHLKLRRQFVFGPRIIQRCANWQHIKLKSDGMIAAHPELEVTHIQHGELQLVLLGYLLDPYHINFSNKQILENLAQQTKNLDDLTRLTNHLSGRWILFISSSSKNILFNDPSGYRQVFYTTPDVGNVWCASQPKLIAEELGLTFDNEAQEHFVNSNYVKNTREYWWPGDGTQYLQIKHLLPNHQLELGTQKVSRFWPRQPICSVSLTSGTQKAAEFLENLIQSAANRFPLALPLTAGLDSRMLLAAARKISRDIFTYTLMYPPLTRKSEDIIIPSKLLTKLGHIHHLIECPTTMEQHFAKIYHDNVSLAHDQWGAIAYGLFIYYPQDRVCLKGVSSEIARCRYYRYHYPKTISGERLAQLSGFGSNIYAIRAFEPWLTQACQVENDFGYKVLDLFHWEQRLGNWQAMSQLEWDIAQEEFAPFNCRALLETLLAVDSKHRCGRQGKLFIEIIKQLWPEVLSEPINPMGIKGHLRHVAKTIKGKLTC